MKMNFKYVSMMACAALMAGFTSCSNDDDAIDNGIVPNGESAKVIISLTQAAQGTRATETATDEEKAIKNATLYVFGAGKKLVAEEVLNNATGENTLTIETGTNYFYVAVNKNDDVVSTDFVVGTTTMEQVAKTVLTLASIDDLTDASKGFFMTNVGKPLEKIIKPSTTGAENKITIPVGRAVAKVAINLADDADQPEDGTLALDSYQMGGNQKSMYLFPVFSGTDLLTPSYDLTYDENTADKYFALGGKVNAGDPTYVVENATKERPAIQGKSTHALIKGIYTPATWLDANGGATTPSSDGTFYRVYDTKNGVFFTEFYAEKPADKANNEVAKYEGGICYYSYFIGDGEIDIKRNNYYKVNLVAVSGVGANQPDENKDLDGNPFEPQLPPVIDPEKPIKEDAKIIVDLEVLPWTVETVEGGI